MYLISFLISKLYQAFNMLQVFIKHSVLFFSILEKNIIEVLLSIEFSYDFGYCRMLIVVSDP